MDTTSRPLVLLVEDHGETREGFTNLLRAEGYRVATAMNGDDALNRLRAGLRPDAIILDLMMPVMSGYEFRQRQLEHPEIAEIPLVVYSATTDATENAKHLQAAAYVQKPITGDALLGALRKVVSAPR